MKSKKLLDSFTNYCNLYPKERFWQALRNWSRYYFIYGSCSPEGLGEIEDTFYREEE